jgi:hypothetical protein
MGVDVVEMKTPLQVGLSLTETFDFGPPGMTDAPAKAYLVERRYNNAFAVLNELLKDNTDVYWIDNEFSIDGKTYPAGTFIIPGQKGIDKKLQSLANEFKVPVYGINQPVPVKGTKALLPRLGLYHPWTASMDEGWTRLVLDNYHYSYKKLYNAEIKKGKLAEKFDVIIIPDLSISSIVEGKRRRWGYSEPALGDARQPEKYRGGIGKEGVKALTDFVKAGGTLITFGQASNFAIEKIRVPAVNVLKGIDSREFYAPGSLLQIELDTAQPLAYGMPEKTAIRMTNSPAFSLRLHIQESRAIGYYGEDNPLLSGWLKGPEKLAGRTALAEILVEKGRVILFGFRVQSRAQTFGTFKLLFNAIHTSRIQSVKTLEFKN